MHCKSGADRAGIMSVLYLHFRQGKTIAEARALFARFHAEVTGETVGEAPEALADDADRLAPLTGVKAFPVRVKCATLPWHTLEAALKNDADGQPVKTE